MTELPWTDFKKALRKWLWNRNFWVSMWK